MAGQRYDGGNQGSRPGQTRTERMEKARAGAFRGKQYPGDGQFAGQKGGSPRDVGQGTNVVRKSPMAPDAASRTGNDPWERPTGTKPGGRSFD